MNVRRIVYLADASSIHVRRWAGHFAQRGYEVHAFSFLPAEIPGVNVHVMNAGRVDQAGGNWRYLLHLPALRSQLYRLHPDLVHTHYLTSYGLLGALSGFRPLVHTAWGSDVLDTPRHSWVYRRLLRFTLARADLVTSDAVALSQEILRYGLPAERLLTVPLGVDAHLFSAEGRSWPECGLQLISTRHLLPNSSLETVLMALAQARQSLAGLHLRVIGKGPEGPHLQEMARQLGVDDAIAWQGAVDHDRLPSLLREADVYLALTLSDSTSVSLLEAMACGALPIVTDLPSNREWIEPEVNGLLVAPGDAAAATQAILRAVRDVDLRQRAARHNAALINTRADWDKNMDQVEARYRALVEPPISTRQE